jgi:hypothetical protein
MFGRKSRYSPMRSGKPKRTGKTRLGRTSASRPYQKRKAKLRSKGYKLAGGKPVNFMNDAEFAKLQQKISSGKYETQSLVQPPVWRDEPPREYIMLRRKKR